MLCQRASLVLTPLLSCVCLPHPAAGSGAQQAAPLQPRRQRRLPSAVLELVQEVLVCPGWPDVSQMMQQGVAAWLRSRYVGSLQDLLADLTADELMRGAGQGQGAVPPRLAKMFMRLAAERAAQAP